jgi:colicin import membrane protein
VSQIDIDIQLKVWKDLALSKQVLMGAATDALGLDAECSSTELKEALEKAIKKVKEADANILETKEKAEKEVAEMKALVESSDKARKEAEERIAAAEEAREIADRALAAGRAENSEHLKKARADVADKQNKLKAISKALADTPENVVKKLKTLKKQKMDESKLRTQAEAKLKTTTKEKAKLEAQVEEQKAFIEKAGAAAEQIETLHKLCKDQNKKIKSLSEEKDDLFEIPKLDKELIETLKSVTADK